MKIAIDTSALVEITESSEQTRALIRILRAGNWKHLVVAEQVRSEFNPRSEEQSANYASLQPFIEADEISYFTLDSSLLDGPDIFAPETVNDVRESHADMQGAYERYKTVQEKQDLPVKDQMTWIKQNMRQSDATIYARALDTECDALLTNDVALRRKIKKSGNKIRTFSVKDFLLGSDK